MEDTRFISGLTKLESYDLSLDVWLYHHQLDELVSLVDGFPEVTFILNHIGGLIGVGPYGANRGNTLAIWKFNLRKLAERPNVFLKVGGMGMPVFGFGFENKPHPAASAALAEVWRPLIDICISAFGTQRCMFESNYPVDRQASRYVEIWNAFKKATRSLSHSEREDLFFGTACRAYRLT